jgi:tetratricopeptide (TPR) repeat protein
MRVLAAARDRAMELAALLATATVLSIPRAEMRSTGSPRNYQIGRWRCPRIKDRGAEAHILRNLMLIARWTQDPADAARYGEESLAIARACNLRQETAFALNDLAVHGYLDAGQLDKALASAREARQLWQELNNLPMLADSLSSSALANYALGNFEDVIAATGESLKISETIGNLWGQSYARWIVGNVYSDRGEPERATQIMEDCIRFGEQAGFAGAEVGVRNMLAMVAAECGMFDRRGDRPQSSAVAERRFAAGTVDPGCQRLYAHAVRLPRRVRSRSRFVEPVEYHIGRGWRNLIQLTLAKADVALAKDDPTIPSALEVLIQYYAGLTFGRCSQGALHKGKSTLHVVKEAAQNRSPRRCGRTARHTAVLWKIYIALRGNPNGCRLGAPWAPRRAGL